MDMLEFAGRRKVLPGNRVDFFVVTWREDFSWTKVEGTDVSFTASRQFFRNPGGENIPPHVDPGGKVILSMLDSRTLPGDVYHKCGQGFVVEGVHLLSLTPADQKSIPDRKTRVHKIVRIQLVLTSLSITT